MCSCQNSFVSIFAVLQTSFRRQAAPQVTALGGQSVRLNCTPPVALPAAEVHWLHDGRRVNATARDSRSLLSASVSAASDGGGGQSQSQADAVIGSGSQESAAADVLLVTDSDGSHDLLFQRVRAEDIGNYVCVASNPAGERRSSPTALNVLCMQAGALLVSSLVHFTYLIFNILYSRIVLRTTN